MDVIKERLWEMIDVLIQVMAEEDIGAGRPAIWELIQQLDGAVGMIIEIERLAGMEVKKC